MFQNLTENISKALRVLSGNARITEVNISAVLKEIRTALLDADVEYSVVKKFIETTRAKALGIEVTKGVNPSQMMVKIIHDELVAILGSETVGITIDEQRVPSVIMVAGLQGAGKTTFVAKLANQLKKKGRSVMLIAGDIYRPAAVEQLKILGEKIEVPVFSMETTDVVKLAKEGIAAAKRDAKSVVIVDTAGRTQIDEEMMDEIKRLKEALSPQEILFVVDGTIGQEAVTTAKAFNEKLNFHGVVVTKMDGDTRGGAVLSIKSVLGKPIKYISQGEKIDDIDIFYPDRIASRILGMGDVVSLVEMAQEKMDTEKMEQLGKKFLKSDFTLEDFLSQLQEVKKMGSFKSVLGMLPGMSGVSEQIDEREFVKMEAIIHSMTKEERANPSLINGNRRNRIYKGSGTSLQDVNKLLKQFEGAKRMMKSVSKGAGAGRMMMENPMMKELMQAQQRFKK